MYEELRELALEAKEAGLVVVVWSYPRGSGISKTGRDGDRRLRLRRADRRPARRAHHQGQGADRPHRAGGGAQGLRSPGHQDRHPGRPRQARDPERLRRPPHRDLLRRRGQGDRGRARGEPADRPRRRIRHDHGPQLVPARARRGRQAAPRTSWRSIARRGPADPGGHAWPAWPADDGARRRIGIGPRRVPGSSGRILGRGRRQAGDGRSAAAPAAEGPGRGAPVSRG